MADDRQDVLVAAVDALPWEERLEAPLLARIEMAVLDEMVAMVFQRRDRHLQDLGQRSSVEARAFADLLDDAAPRLEVQHRPGFRSHASPLEDRKIEAGDDEEVQACEGDDLQGTSRCQFETALVGPPGKGGALCRESDESQGDP